MDATVLPRYSSRVSGSDRFRRMPDACGAAGPHPCRQLGRGIGALAILPLLAAAPPDRGRIAYVIDGDTVRLDGGERIRIAGIDAPETRVGQARCAREIQRGKAATAVARALLDGREVTIVRVGRSYQRTVAHLQLEGRDVASDLVRRGAARTWPRGRSKPDWCRA